MILLAATPANSQGLTAGNYSIAVDPSVPMTTGTGNFATEWNTGSSLENWVATQANATVSAGVLRGTATGTDARVSLSNFTSGPDLDLGWNDFLELRIQVPQSYQGVIQVYFGTTSYSVSNESGGTELLATTGFQSSRMITIPASVIPKDGAFHTYRIDLGLHPLWRATLRDLRIDPVDGAGSSGMAFAIDYIRVGDEPNATNYQTRSTSECPAVGAATPSGAAVGAGQAVLSMESKHFRFSWNKNVAAQSAWTTDMAHGTLRNLEEVWQVYVKKMGYRQPNQEVGNLQGAKFKLNVISWHSGYWAGVDSGFAYLNITPDGLRVDPPSWVVPHELMHCFQFHNTSNNVPGEWFEFHANYGRERWLEHYQVLYPAASGIDPTHLRCSHQTIEDGRQYYLSWPIFLYLDENPDGLPDLGEGTSAKIWQETQTGEYSLTALDRLTPTTSLKDIAGYNARRGVTYHFSNQAAIKAALSRFDAPLDNAATERWQFTDLVLRPDLPGWWRVPYEMAPMQGGYAIHELVPEGTGAGRVVTVNLRGVADRQRGADWRASFIIISDGGSERYSSLWGEGVNSVTLAADENKVYLSVAGAPGIFHYGGPADDVYPYRSHPSKSRFPYEIQVTGATPRQRDNGASTGLVIHSNGGGYKASSISVPSSVYIGSRARVMGGTVSGNARIEDYAVVSGGSVSGNAVVSGHAWVRGGTISGNAKIRDWALIEGGVINLDARVLEHANIKGGTVTDSATAKGSAASLSGTLSGNAIIDGNYGDFFSGRDVANGVAFGHVPYVGVPDSHIRALRAGIYASYDFSEDQKSRILDNPGVTDGFTIGAPTWVAADARRKGFLMFDGTSQYVNLDRSVADQRTWTFTAWVKPLGGVANQSVLWVGASETRRLYFTPDNGTGKAEFSIVNGGAQQKLTSSSALPPGIWSHVAITLDGSNGTLYINGVSAASGAISLRADQVLPPNTATDLQHIYLARGEGGLVPKFHGALDDVRFYNKALTLSDVAAMQPAVSPASAGTVYIDLRANDASAGTASWSNNGTLAGFTRIGAPSKVVNVSNSGIPGVQFNGTADAYAGPASVADIQGSSDRTIEVWAYNPSLDAEETVVSWGHRGSDGRDMAFNFGNHVSWGAATHWGAADMGWGTPPQANGWHHLAYTYDGGTTVKVYIDGALANSKTLGGALNTFAGEMINIGCQRDSAGGARSLFFSGYLNTIRIHGGVLNADQIYANASLGPAGQINSPPSLGTVADQIVDFNTPSAPISLNPADSDTALGAITLDGAPANESIIPKANIVFSGSGASRMVTITPAAGAAGSTTVTLSVSDGAAIGTRTFTVLVLTPSETWRRQNFGNFANTGIAADSADPDGDGWVNAQEYAAGTDPKNPKSLLKITAAETGSGNFKVTFPSVLGHSYAVEYSDTLGENSWQTVKTNGIPAVDIPGTGGPIQVTHTGGASGQKRFYRIRVGS